MPRNKQKSAKQIQSLPDLATVLKSRFASPLFGYITLEEQGDALQQQANAAIARDIQRGAPDISKNILSKQANTIINLYSRAKELAGLDTEPQIIHRSDIPKEYGGRSTAGFTQINESKEPNRIAAVTALGLTDNDYGDPNQPVSTAAHELGHVLDFRDPNSTTASEERYHYDRAQNFHQTPYKAYKGNPREMVASRFSELVSGNNETDLAEAYNRAVERKNNRLVLRSMRQNFELDEKTTDR